MRWSQMHIPTLRQDPADAGAASHRLLLRAGCIRQLMAGHYSLLPLAVRVRTKVIGIIREEMDRIGAQEILMPSMQPAEAWRRSGRWDAVGDELFRLKDRRGADLALGMTHEEIVATLGAELTSYRELPQIWYQFQVKFRDEPRPKAGLMRTREFTMKDSYSFDLTADELDRSYGLHYEAYTRIFARLGITAIPVDASNGSMGGSASTEFACPSDAGEDIIISCPACGYAANIEKATSRLVNPQDHPERPSGPGVSPGDPSGPGVSPGDPSGPGVSPGDPSGPGVSPGDPSGSGVSPGDVAVLAAPEPFDTPGVRTIEDLATQFGAPAEWQVKTLVYLLDDQLTLVLLRGDHILSEQKLADATGAVALRPAHPGEIQAALGALPGSLGAVGVTGIPVIADEALRGRIAMFTGASTDDVHLRGVDVERDIPVRQWADLREVAAGEPCTVCGEPLEARRAIEVGQIFKLGYKYADAMDLKVIGPEGKPVRPIMGSYGIGVERAIAAIVECHHDDDGIVWPVAVAPFQAVVVIAQHEDVVLGAVAEQVYERLLDAGIDTIIDDRAERAGVKFRDAELVGIPFRITVGQRGLAEGAVELTDRATGETHRVPLEEITERVSKALALAAAR
jgi:prolyl-tRNA synthetase